MVDGTYEFESKTPLGKKRGTIVIESTGEEAIATIQAVGRTKQVTGKLEGNHATFVCTVKLPRPLGERQFTIDGEVKGDTLEALVSAKKLKFKVVGTRIS